MALACSLSPSAVSPRASASRVCTGRSHCLHLPQVLSLRISVHFERTERRSLGYGAKKSLGFRSRQRKSSFDNAKLASVQRIPRAEEGGGGETVPEFDIARLEAYTDKVRSEVLCVNALVDDEEDQVIVFKGFTSSLTRPTPDDPSEPALPPTAVILTIDRIRAPYTPAKPQYIQQGVSWEEFNQSLLEKSL